MKNRLMFRVYDRNGATVCCQMGYSADHAVKVARSLGINGAHRAQYMRKR